jgi:transposase
VLLAADGLPGKEIAEKVGCSEPTVVLWRSRFATHGLPGLADAPRSGKPPTIPQSVRDAILSITLTEPPTELGITHWSSRLLADRLRREGTPVSHATVARVWKHFGIQPHRSGTFKFSTDPQLQAKVRDIVGLYLNPPEKAIVICVDEKSQIQALDRTAPILPLRPGLPESRTHDYVRHGTTTLFAALEVATGQVTDRCFDRHTNVEFLAFLKQVARAYPRRQLHVVCDNYATHKHPNVRAWLTKNPRVRLHFTPPPAPGSTWWRCSSGSSPGRRSGAAPSPRSRTSSPRSKPSSTPGTSAASPSPGPRTPTPSWPRRPIPGTARHKTRQLHATRAGVISHRGNNCFSCERFR